ncbi:hypothetical protein BB561_005330 [Smittium simulii]|uniref:Uncharacterized protein n=1 Tax=Smittium simulii TaxID=133385 RepID=A0A2T9YAW5_9FUNG|nr:hypothetical protein BB561_005330 [Smittium simulii]
MNVDQIFSNLRSPALKAPNKTESKKKLLKTLEFIKQNSETVFAEVSKADEGHVDLLFLLAGCSQENVLWWWADSAVRSEAQGKSFFLNKFEFNNTTKEHEILCIYLVKQYYKISIGCSESQFLSQTFDKVFQKHIKPSFQSSVRAVVNGKVRYKTDFDEYDDTPKWKSTKIGCIPAFMWFLKSLDTSTIDQIYLNSIPIILTLVEDYDISFKIVGIDLVSLVASKVNSQVLIKSGVSDLFIQSIDKLLILRRESKGEILLNCSIKCYLDLINIIYQKTPTEITEKLFHLFYTAIIQNLMYTGNEFSYQVAILSNISLLAKTLKINTVRYLRPLIEEIIPIMEIEILGVETVVELQLEATNALLSILQESFPRVDAYVDQIVPALVLCYDSTCHKLNDKLSLIQKLQYKLAEIFTFILSISSPESKKFIDELETVYPNFKQNLVDLSAKNVKVTN